MRANSLFEKLPPHWNCPSCLRSKNAIVRTLESGELLGQVVEHHDHIRDYPNAAMRELNGSAWIKCIPHGLGVHLNRIETFIIGFSAVTICEDCNNAEGSAKRIVGAHRYFSFAPFEIRSFLKIKPHSKHEIDSQRVSESYNAASNDFELRWRVAQELFTRAINGEYWMPRR